MGAMKHVWELCCEANDMTTYCLDNWAVVSGSFPYPYQVMDKETGMTVTIEDETDVQYILTEYAKHVAANPVAVRFNYTERAFAEDFLHRPARAKLTDDIVSKAFMLAVEEP